MPAALKYKTKTQSLDDGRECILSDGTIDAYGDICEATPTSWVTDRFKKNPLALLNHSSSFPIGTWKNVRVENGQLLGQLNLAPVGTSARHDEVRALIDAKILVGLSVGFVPLESVPIPGKGYRYTKMELMECSVVSIPANENALMKCRSLGISNETQQLLFKDMTIGARIRKARKAVRRAKLLQSKADNPRARESMDRAIATFEKEERELRAGLEPRQSASDRRLARAKEVRARALAKVREIDERIARERERIAREYDAAYEASPAGQGRRHTEQTLANFNAEAQKHQDLPKPVYESSTITWRGVPLPPVKWRGKPVK